MYEPIRGGTRGGQGEFKWSDVSADKDREHYLGHSVNAPTGRWQKNKDVHWYNRDIQDSEEQRREEIRKIKEAEEEALSVALGFAPSKESSSAIKEETSPKGEDHELLALKEEKRRRKAEKAERKEQKRLRKEQKRIARHGEDRHAVRTSRRDDSHSRSPSRSRSRSPYHRVRSGRGRDYDASRRSDSRQNGSHEQDEREHEREFAPKRWDDNTRPNQPGQTKWGRER